MIRLSAQGAAVWVYPEMATNWATLRYPQEKVNEAGETLRKRVLSGDEYATAVNVINNWRSAHSFPLNTFQTTLRKKARSIDTTSLVAQRLKRLSSIDKKLKRFRDLPLAEMQDIAGCRAVLRSVPHVKRLVTLYETGNLKHGRIDRDDYIETPKRSGYRGYHLIYQYKSDKKGTWNGFKVEMQLRSALQHAWATAVETVDMFTGQALKASGGSTEWRTFFRLMSASLAMREATPPVRDTPQDRDELREQLRQHAEVLEVVGRLESYRAALRNLQQPQANARYYLIVLDPKAQVVTVKGYGAGPAERKIALDEYAQVEQTLEEERDAVLVAVESIATLYRAYPNYFFDTRLFIEAVQEAMEQRTTARRSRGR